MALKPKRKNTAGGYITTGIKTNST